MVHLGWSKVEKVPKKDELRGIVEGRAISAKLLELLQVPVVPALCWGFEQYLQLEKEKAKMERERFWFELKHERLRQLWRGKE